MPDYFSYDMGEVPSGSFIRAINYVQNKVIGVIAGCDVNVYHICWRSSNINARRSKLSKYLVGTDL